MTPLIDLHAHPTLKMYLWPFVGASFNVKTPTGGFRNPVSFRTSLPYLSAGATKVLVASHYVIERGFVLGGVRRHSQAIVMALAPTAGVKLAFSDPWKTVNKMWGLLETAAEKANRQRKPGTQRVRMLRSAAEMADLADDEIGVAHSIEGAHAFGYGPKKGQSLEAFWDQTRTRIGELADRGLALVTLAHFWDNMFSPQTDGTELIPHKRLDGRVVAGMDDLMARMKRASWRWDDPERLCEPFARELLRRGIVVDLSHTQEHARWRVYDLCEEYGRPVTLTHVGLQHYYPHEYNVSDAEIRRVHALGGVIGLIFSLRLLQHPVKLYRYKGGGLEFLTENVLYVKDLVGDLTALGIGTDFDGFTDPFRDCYHSGMLGAVEDALSKHLHDEEIRMVLWGNSKRLLEQGWGGAQQRGRAVTQPV